ncbi:protein kinase domain protein [Cordyceps militaris CM01]|uniref:Protein kinase domain protein n=1 Tax=Cordyceps militaris (strain CM01) TaxID=983644 RepID=G3JTN7_CORMM|nr:protein kinase domain protein [Cordyceps militaris CM01]EGX88041.1 protein kinase domain protein [Cordyceps militaris CM01]
MACHDNEEAIFDYRPLLRRAVSKVASQPPDGNEAPDLDSGICFHAIDDAEAFSRYGPGGYHPVVVGDRLDGRYRILNKLGHGSYSTVWLARDETLQRLVAVKVCTADARPRESEILHILNNFSEADGSNVSGPRMLPTLLSTFRVDGPNGTHTCLVTEVTRCSVVEAKRRSTSAPLMLPVARAIAAQLILAVDYLHQNGFVHGDLHLGNVLLKLPRESHFWSDEELLLQCGEPELEPVQTFDDQPIPSGVPSVATLPIWFPMGETNELTLSDAPIVLADFGESYRASQESKFTCCTPAHCRPPESRFEPTTPKSFSSDIWTLACAVWATLAQRPLFDVFWCTEDTATWMQVQTLGKLPDEWWEKWDARVNDFAEDGQPLRRDDSPVYTFDYQFEDAMQGGRRRYEMETMGSAEKEALLGMLRPMLAYKPEQRCSVRDVVASEWMTKYAMPEYERMRALEKKHLNYPD